MDTLVLVADPVELDFMVIVGSNGRVNDEGMSVLN